MVTITEKQKKELFKEAVLRSWNCVENLYPRDYLRQVLEFPKECHLYYLLLVEDFKSYFQID